jgi:putative NADPH-quinone reductase
MHPLCAAKSRALMSRKITIIEGHPDPDPSRFGYALASAYENGALAGGHEVRRIRVSELTFPVLRTRAEWQSPPPPCIVQAQEAIRWADHLLLLFPLWLSGTPALLRAFFEQVLRPGFATQNGRKLLGGRSAGIVITMGRPVIDAAWKSTETGLLGYCGIDPIREMHLCGVDGDVLHRTKWLAQLQELGFAGDLS